MQQNEEQNAEKIENEQTIALAPENEKLVDEPAPVSVVAAPNVTTPLPKKRLLIIFIIHLCDVCSLTTLLPYLGYMIKDFGITSDDDRVIGYYAGLVASSYYFAQFFSSFIWGWLSDRIGRRPVMLIGLFGNVCTIVAFGFSKFLWYALVVRMAFGLINGNLGMCKTYIGEITDSTNQASAFSVITLTFGVGALIGPLIGGFLSRPVAQYPWFAEKMPSFVVRTLDYFPYLLPNLVIGMLSLSGFILAVFYLTESNKKLLAKRQKQQEKKEDEVELKDVKLEPKSKEYLVEESSVFPKWWPKNEILRERGPIVAVCCYGTLGFLQIMYDEVYPLLAILPVADGGFGFSPAQIGLIASIAGVIIIFVNLIITHRIVKRFGAVNSFRVASIATLPSALFMPSITYLLLFDSIIAKILVWVCFVFVAFFRVTCLNISFTCVVVLVNNSVFPDNMGVVNGLGQSVVALTRTIGPTVGATLFSWSLTNGLAFPLNKYFVFVVICVGQIAQIILAFLLPATQRKPKLEVKKDMEKLKQVAPEPAP